MFPLTFHQLTLNLIQYWTSVNNKKKGGEFFRGRKAFYPCYRGYKRHIILPPNAVAYTSHSAKKGTKKKVRATYRYIVKTATLFFFFFRCPRLLAVVFSKFGAKFGAGDGNGEQQGEENDRGCCRLRLRLRRRKHLRGCQQPRRGVGCGTGTYLSTCTLPTILLCTYRTCRIYGKKRGA